MIRSSLVAVTAGLLVACSATFERPSADADFGTVPVGYELAIRAYFDEVLKDPDSAIYRIGRPVRAYRNRGLAWGGQVTWRGYAVDFQMNAKNSFGGYVGFKAYTALFSEGRLVRMIEGEDTLLRRM